MIHFQQNVEREGKKRQYLKKKKFLFQIVPLFIIVILFYILWRPISSQSCLKAKPNWNVWFFFFFLITYTHNGCYSWPNTLPKIWGWKECSLVLQSANFQEIKFRSLTEWKMWNFTVKLWAIINSCFCKRRLQKIYTCLWCKWVTNVHYTRLWRIVCQHPVLKFWNQRMQNGETIDHIQYLVLMIDKLRQ